MSTLPVHRPLSCRRYAVGGVLVTALLAFVAGGCAGDPGLAPAGPGATSRADLSPWFASAPTVTYTGHLLYFHCTSDRGNFYTWALTPAGPEDANEVDVRACLGDAERLEGRCVTITGRLIERGKHFPILVAERIVPAQPDALVDHLPPGVLLVSSDAFDGIAGDREVLKAILY